MKHDAQIMTEIEKHVRRDSGRLSFKSKLEKTVLLETFSFNWKQTHPSIKFTSAYTLR